MLLFSGVAGFMCPKSMVSIEEQYNISVAWRIQYAITIISEHILAKLNRSEARIYSYPTTPPRALPPLMQGPVARQPSTIN